MGGYRTQSRDTNPEAERVLIERYRGMDPAEKVEMVRSLSGALEALSLAGLRLRHPRADAQQLRMLQAALRLSRADMLRAYGWRDDQPSS